MKEGGALAVEEVSGIVLFKKPHRERDYLIKIFTDRYGPLMFFIRGSRRSDALAPQIMPLLVAKFYVDIRTEGLSFLRDIKQKKHLLALQHDIEKNAYGIYISSLTDAALVDREANYTVFSQLLQALTLIDEGVDPEIITFMYELKRLAEFGVMPNWVGCAICGRQTGAFDYSSKYHGILCSKHYLQDKRRFHASPAAIHLLRQLNFLEFKQLGKIQVKSATKSEMKRVLDKIYEEDVGIHLKSKHFIEQMKKYDDFFK